MVRLTSQGRSTHWPRQSPPVYEARCAVRRTAVAPTTPTATWELNRRACAASYCKNNQYAACACSAFLRWIAPAWVLVGRTRSKRIHDSSGRGRATAHLSNAISPGGRNETLTPEEQTEVSGFFTATPPCRRKRLFLRIWSGRCFPRVDPCRCRGHFGLELRHRNGGKQ